MMEVMDESDLERELEEADKVNTSTSYCSHSQRIGQNGCRHLSQRSLGIWWGLVLASVPPSFLW